MFNILKYYKLAFYIILLLKISIMLKKYIIFTIISSTIIK